jgi:acyl-CoA thioester hydrolase
MTIDVDQKRISETVRRTVEWVDTDAAGHHHNSFVLRCVEAAEARLFQRLGVLEEYFGSAPRVRQEIDYVSKLYFGQEVTTELVLEAVGSASMTFGFNVWGERYPSSPAGYLERRLAATGRFITVHVPAGGEASAPWPDTIRLALAAGAEQKHNQDHKRTSQI